MLFPDVTLKEWIKKYPALSAIEVECLHCSGTILTEKPFVTKDYVGLSASECPHCKVPHKAYTGIPYSKEELEAWYQLQSK
jgi:hypothetical protein